MTSSRPTSVTILLGPSTTHAGGQAVTAERPGSHSRTATVHEQLTELREALDARSRVIVVATDLIAPSVALSPITDDALGTTTTLLAPDRTGRVTVRHHTVVSAGSSFHDIRNPSHTSVIAFGLQPNRIAIRVRGFEALRTTKVE